MNPIIMCYVSSVHMHIMYRRFFHASLLFLVTLGLIASGCGTPIPAPTETIPARTATLPPHPTSLPSATSSPTWTPTPIRTQTLSPTPRPPTYTPTAIPTLPPELASLKVVYIDQDTLWIWQNGVSTALTTADELTTVSISPDKEKIAFTRGGELLLINMDGTGERVLVDRDTIEPNAVDGLEAYLIFSEWIQDGSFLIFYMVHWAGPEWTWNEDLYLVNTQTGEHWTIFSPGTGGQVYASPDGEHIAVVSHTSIRLINFDGSDRKTVLTYEHVLYPTDVPWYPRVAWAPDSQSLWAGIDSVDAPDNPDALSTIWNIPLEGEPISVLQVNADHLLSFSPDLSMVAYQTEIRQDNSRRFDFHIDHIDGSGGIIYFPPDGWMNLIKWFPDSTGIIFDDNSEDSLLQVLKLDDPTHFTTILGPFRFNRPTLEWVDASHFVMWTGAHDQQANIWIGTLYEPIIPIVQLNHISNVVNSFDFAR